MANAAPFSCYQYPFFIVCEGARQHADDVYQSEGTVASRVLYFIQVSGMAYQARKNESEGPKSIFLLGNRRK